MRTNLSEDEMEGDQTRTNHVLFRPIGQELLCKLVRSKLDQQLTNPAEPSAAEVRAAISGFKDAEWRLHKAPWRHLLWVFESDRERWKMRSEDRKAAVQAAELVMRFILGIDSYTQTDLDHLQAQWRARLLDCSEEEANELWESIKEQALARDSA